MDAYALFLISEITDRELYQHYGEGFMEVFNKYEGTIIAITGTPTSLEGDWPYKRTVLLSFPSTKALNAWYKSWKYQVIIQQRCNRRPHTELCFLGLVAQIQRSLKAQTKGLSRYI